MSKKAAKMSKEKLWKMKAWRDIAQDHVEKWQ